LRKQRQSAPARSKRWSASALSSGCWVSFTRDSSRVELELVQTHMAQKQMLRGEVGARVRVVRACGQRRCSWLSLSHFNPGPLGLFEMENFMTGGRFIGALSPSQFARANTSIRIQISKVRSVVWSRAPDLRQLGSRFHLPPSSFPDAKCQMIAKCQMPACNTQGRPGFTGAC